MTKTTLQHEATGRTFDAYTFESWGELDAALGTDNWIQIGGDCREGQQRGGYRTAGIALGQIKRSLKREGHGYRDGDTFAVYRTAMRGGGFLAGWVPARR